MRVIPLLIILSVVANLVLAVTLWRRPASAPSAAESAAPNTPSSLAANSAASTAAPSSAPRAAPLWTGVQPYAIDDALGRLRAAGCPPRELAAAAQAMIFHLMQEKRAALGFANETLPYWQQFRQLDNPAAGAELSALQMEMQRLQRTHLLTPELFAADEQAVASYRQRYGNLDTEKLRRLALIESESMERFMSTSQTASTKPGEARYPEAARSTHEEIERQKDAAIMATLTAEEYAQYELRSSSTANRLRARLAPFRPTEEEYKALFALEKARTSNPASVSLTAEQRQAAQQQHEADLLTALGPERAADYDALQKAGGDSLPRLIARLDLPLVTVSVLNNVRSETGAQAKAILGDSRLSPAERTEQLNALIQQAETRLGSALGSPRAVEAYKDLKGEWLRNLRQSAVPAR